MPSSAVCHTTPSPSNIARTSPTNSAFASFEPLLPREPVNLLMQVPQDTSAEFIFSNTPAKLGSYAAVTSEERHFEA